MKKSLKIVFWISALSVILFIQSFSCTYAKNTPSRTLYVLAARFDTVLDGIPLETLVDFWQSEKPSAPEPNFISGIILTGSSKRPVFESLGQSANRQISYVNDTEQAIHQAIIDRSWIILPFDQLDPRLKVLAIDGKNPLDKGFIVSGWPLITQNGSELGDFANWEAVPIQNRDESKMTTLMLTGVTAMVRGTASYMDALGPEYPATNIFPELRNADILHINNEVPFAPVCQQTEEDYAVLRFCSKKRALDLLTFIGTDIVELDGDHFQDYGDEAMYYTLDLYKEAGIPYYGGGINIEEAAQPLLITHNGNQFAFIGCNAKEIGYSSASATRPGAIHCDFPKIVEQIKTLKSQGYLPVVTLQHIEYYNLYPNQQIYDDFQILADAGAVIVSGSQSHIPMAFDISKDSFLHYGLGNLFFDQAFFLPETSEATIDRHVFYDGKHLSTQLLTIKFTNLALNRFMTPEERGQLLERIFSESGIDGQ